MAVFESLTKRELTVSEKHLAGVIPKFIENLFVIQLDYDLADRILKYPNQYPRLLYINTPESIDKRLSVLMALIRKENFLAKTNTLSKKRQYINEFIILHGKKFDMLAKKQKGEYAITFQKNIAILKEKIKKFPKPVSHLNKRQQFQRQIVIARLTTMYYQSGLAVVHILKNKTKL